MRVGREQHMMSTTPILQKLTQSQRNDKGNAKIVYCPWVSGGRLMTRSILNDLKLEG